MPAPLASRLQWILVGVLLVAAAATVLGNLAGSQALTAFRSASEDATPLVRTDYARADRWSSLLQSIATPSAEGFLARVTLVEDATWAGLPQEDVRRLAQEQDDWFFVLVADTVAQADDEFPILVVDTSGEDRPSFRVAARCLWAVENNLSLANMDWEEFAGSVEADGVYRAC